MRVLSTSCVLLLLFTFSNSIAYAHSGRTDSSGGHNCRVGSCAGTYHYHNSGSSYIPPKPTYSPPKPTYVSPPKEEVRGTSVQKPASVRPPTPVPTPTPEKSSGSGWVMLLTGLGGGYWLSRKVARKKADRNPPGSERG